MGQQLGIWGFLRFYLKLIPFFNFFGMTFCPEFFFKVFFFLFDYFSLKKVY
jgi:hypothetical protein